jgi:hypothetical protein
MTVQYGVVFEDFFFIFFTNLAPKLKSFVSDTKNVSNSSVFLSERKIASADTICCREVLVK